VGRPPLLQRYHDFLEVVADEVVDAAPSDFLVRDIAGVAASAGAHLAFSFAHRYPREADRLLAAYEESAGLTDRPARIQIDRAMRALREVVQRG
jgi:hypothetical protein